MIKDLWLIGIGTGSLSHVTLEGVSAMRDARVILVPRKGDEKGDLAELRLQILDQAGSSADVRFFDYPTRDPALPYQDRVSKWHDEIAKRWTRALEEAALDGPVALLVWGDPSLYDSTLRIAQRLDPAPDVRVIPGITAIQALTAAHRLPLNTVNGEIRVTTGRRIRDRGLSGEAETTLVMLDGECSFQRLKGQGLDIWWGAYLGSEQEVLCAGALDDVADQIVAMREDARRRHGWIMDTYLIRPTGVAP